MQLNSDINYTPENEVIYLPFEEELFLNVTKFDYSSFMLNTLYETCKDQKFLNKLFIWLSEKFNLDIDQIRNYFNNNFDEETRESLGKLVDTQYHRIQMLTIEFMFELLPFNYLIKISQKRGRKLSDLMVNFRGDLLECIEGEIKQIDNMLITLNTVRNGLQNKEQLKKFSGLHSASISVARKTQLENMYLYSIVNSWNQDNIKDILTQLLDDDLVYNNLYEVDGGL